MAFDHDGRPVKALTAADLAVVDNEWVVKNFRSFTYSPEMNLNVIVLVDSSESVARRFRNQTDAVVSLLANGHWTPADTVSVFSFGAGEPQFLCSEDCHGTPLTNRLLGIRPAGQTRLFDAAVFAVRLLADTRDPAVRSVVVVFSDGEDNGSRYSANDVVAAAQMEDVALYTVNANDPGLLTQGSRTLDWMASATGGLHLSFGRQRFPRLLAALDDARAAHILTYTPPNRTAGAHWVQVLPTRNLKLTFRCRQTYFYREMSRLPKDLR